MKPLLNAPLKRSRLRLQEEYRLGSNSSNTQAGTTPANHRVLLHAVQREFPPPLKLEGHSHDTSRIRARAFTSPWSITGS